jgi:hypothetical protein
MIIVYLHRRGFHERTMTEDGNETTDDRHGRPVSEILKIEKMTLRGGRYGLFLDARSVSVVHNTT